MSAGAGPDLSGNVTAGAICVSCSGQSQINPKKAQDYGGLYFTIGMVKNPCESVPCTSGCCDGGTGEDFPSQQMGDFPEQPVGFEGEPLILA